MTDMTTLAATDGAGRFAATIAAHGGDAFLRFQSLTMTGCGTFTAPPQTGGMRVPIAKFTATIADGGRCRFVSEGPGIAITFVVRGDGNGGFVTLAGRKRELPANHVEGMEPFVLLRRAALSSWRVTIPTNAPDEMTEDGKPLLVFQLHRPGGNLSTFWVEEDTRLVRKAITFNARGEMSVLLSNYRHVQGIAVFGTMLLCEDGAEIVRLHMRNVVINAPMEAVLFL